MLRTITVLFTVLNLLCFSSVVVAQEEKEDSSGDFVYVEGDVKIKEKGSDEWIQVTESSKLSEGAVIKLGSNSFTEVKLSKNNSLKVNEESEISISSSTEKPTVELFYGALKARIKKLKGAKLEIRTPVAVAAVRGTEFAVIHEEEKTAELEVYDGEVSFQNLSKKEETPATEVIVTKDQWASAGLEFKAEIKGKITAKRELRWKHMRLKKELFRDRMKLKRGRIEEIRLTKKHRIIRNSNKKEQLKKQLDKIIAKNKEIESSLNEKKTTLKNVVKEYRKYRIKRTGIRRKLIERRNKKMKNIKK